MRVSLVPCPACERHVRATESICPFCASSIERAAAAAPPREIPRGLPRAAVFALGASLTLTACGSTTVGGNDAAEDSARDVTSDEGGPLAMDSGPSVDVVAEDSAAIDASDTPPPVDVVEDDGTILAMYGGPPPDDVVDPDASDVVSEDTGFFPLYGAPPFPDVIPD